VDWVLQKFRKQLKLEHGSSAHSMRATFMTTALENDAKLKDVQHTVDMRIRRPHSWYDQRRFMLAQSAALVVEYCTDRVISAMVVGDGANYVTTSWLCHFS